MATIWEKTAVNIVQGFPVKIHTRHRHVVKKSDEITLADLRGVGHVRPPLSPLFLFLCSFWQKIIPYNRLGPPLKC